MKTRWSGFTNLEINVIAYGFRFNYPHLIEAKDRLLKDAQAEQSRRKSIMERGSESEIDWALDP